MHDFELIECFLFENGYYRHVDRHLQRLSCSSITLGFECNIHSIQKALQDYREKLSFNEKYKVRLINPKTPGFHLSAESIKLPINQQQKITLYLQQPVLATDYLLQHKTIHSLQRDFYQHVYQEVCSTSEFFDVIFINSQGRITEGSKTNIFIELHGKLITPPVSEGLLPGVMRSVVMESERVIEQPITVDELQAADQVWLTNSVIGRMKVDL